MSCTNVNHLSQPCVYDRKSRFMKWLSKLFKVGHSNRRFSAGGEQPQSFGNENTAWRAPVKSLDGRSRASKEKEELDRAIALSLAEDLKKPNGYKWRMESDEDLAKKVNDGFGSAPYPSYASKGHRLCGGCEREIVYGNYLGCMGMFYHPECFRCRACGYPITEREFSLSGRDAYHKSCFKELTHPKCEVCHHFIPTNGVGLIEYRCHPFWTQKYCPSHEHDNTARCCSCERLESWNTRYTSLGDGRRICLECMESAIMDTGDCQPLYHSIRDFYEGMNMRIDQQIPMLLVERHALNEAIEGEKHQGFHQMPETRGLCLSEEQTVTSVRKRPRMERSGLVGIRTQPEKLIRRCEVTAILVLYGLPRVVLSDILKLLYFPLIILNISYESMQNLLGVGRLLTGAILAHELMHGWLRLNGYRNLTPEVEEGICQVLSYLWLESEVLPEMRNMPSTSSSSSPWASSKKGARSSAENKLGKFFMHQIAHDASSNYGGGYRSAMSAVNKYGLRSTLAHIWHTGTFPV